VGVEDGHCRSQYISGVDGGGREQRAGWSEDSHVTDTRATQVILEQWLTTNPNAQTTQVLVEHWASVPTTTVQALATFVAVEQWASVANVSGQGPRVLILA
jgi:hypothetical protein